MRRGDIIVCASITRDIARTFGLAAGVIAEMGGPLSNRAIMARERGIPAVLAVKDATRRISDGQRIAIDGAGGTVTLPRYPH